jgi:hypothetical protein
VRSSTRIKGLELQCGCEHFFPVFFSHPGSVAFGHAKWSRAGDGGGDLGTQESLGWAEFTFKTLSMMLSFLDGPLWCRAIFRSWYIFDVFLRAALVTDIE